MGIKNQNIFIVMAVMFSLFIFWLILADNQPPEKDQIGFDANKNQTGEKVTQQEQNRLKKLKQQQKLVKSLSRLFPSTKDEKKEKGGSYPKSLPEPHAVPKEEESYQADNDDTREPSPYSRRKKVLSLYPDDFQEEVSQMRDIFLEEGMDPDQADKILTSPDPQIFKKIMSPKMLNQFQSMVDNFKRLPSVIKHNTRVFNPEILHPIPVLPPPDGDNSVKDYSQDSR